MNIVVLALSCRSALPNRALLTAAHHLHGPRARPCGSGGSAPAGFISVLLFLMLLTPVLSVSLSSSAIEKIKSHTLAGSTLLPPKGGGVSTQLYPRLANMYAFKDASQVATFARYGLIIAPYSAANALKALKAQSPLTRVLLYADTRSVKVEGFDRFTIYPGWWLTLAGTTLTGNIDAAAQTLHVADASIIAATFPANRDILVDGESMHVVAVNTAARVLTVRRGFHSLTSPHRAGSRVAAHAVTWSGTWMVNVTRYCPIDPHTGLTWVAYMVQEIRRRLAKSPWDGVLLDDANSRIRWVSGGRITATNSNVADGGDGPSGQGWPEGQANLLRQMQGVAPHALILENGGYYPGESSGRLFEHFPYFTGNWREGTAAYLQLFAPIRPNVSIIASDTGDTGKQNLQAMRFGLGTALLGDGYYIYDFGPIAHGQTWWYDEYDGGVGSSLAVGVDSVTTTLVIAPGTGVRFRVGDVLRVPSDTYSATGLTLDDEQMLVSRVKGDVLTVRRGVKGSLAAPHGARDKVATNTQLMAGQGWLGAPLGPASPQPLTTPNLLTDGNIQISPVTGRAVNPWRRWSLSVTTPAAARFNRDVGIGPALGTTARLTVMRAVPDRAWTVNLSQSGCHVEAGVTYTLSFFAKSSTGQRIEAGMQQAYAPYRLRVSQDFTLDREWRRYAMTFNASMTESKLAAQFNLGAIPGVVSFSAVALQRGDSNVWRRDFTRGTVLLNATLMSQTVVLGSGYRHLLGTQDRTINNGTPARSITLVPQDAVVLVATHGL